MTIPIAATIITVLPPTSPGSENRRIASQLIPPTAMSSKAEFASAARIEDRPSP
jgi:hypothetical protein